MNQQQFAAASKLNELETRMKIIDEAINKTEDMLISSRQVQAITRMMLEKQRRAVAALGDVP